VKPTYSNKEITVGILKGDPTILTWCCVHIGPKVIGYIIKNSGTEEEGQSFFRWALMKARENMKNSNYKDEHKIEAYVFSIARNLWLDELRKKKNKQQRETNLEEKEHWVADNSISPLEKIIKEEEINHIHKQLKLLGEKCEQVFQLHYFEEFSFEKMAKLLNIKANALRKRHFDCKKKLQRALMKNIAAE